MGAEEISDYFRSGQIAFSAMNELSAEVKRAILAAAYRLFDRSWILSRADSPLHVACHALLTSQWLSIGLPTPRHCSSSSLAADLDRCIETASRTPLRASIVSGYTAVAWMARAAAELGSGYAQFDDTEVVESLSKAIASPPSMNCHCVVLSEIVRPSLVNSEGC